MCRFKMPKKVAYLDRNLLASQLINELVIFCPSRACDWQGALDKVGSHLKDCNFRTD